MTMPRPKKNPDTTDIPFTESFDETGEVESAETVTMHLTPDDELVAVVDGQEYKFADASDIGVPKQLEPMSLEEMDDLFVERADISEVKRRENPPLRETTLTSSQRDILLRKGLEDILKTNPLDGRIPTAVRYPIDSEGVRSIYAFFDIDARVMERAYRYYKDNAENPTPKDCLDLISEIYAKPKKTVRRMVILNWMDKRTRN